VSTAACFDHLNHTSESIATFILRSVCVSVCALCVVCVLGVCVVCVLCGCAVCGV
jgi:hypothetical protein